MDEFQPFYQHLARDQNSIAALGAVSDFAAEHNHPLADLYHHLFQHADNPHAPRPHRDYHYDHFNGGHHSASLGDYSKGGTLSVQHTFNPTRDGRVAVGLSVSGFGQGVDPNKGTRFDAVVPFDVAERALTYLHDTHPDHFFWEHGIVPRSVGRERVSDPSAHLHLSTQEVRREPLERYARKYSKFIRGSER